MKSRLVFMALSGAMLAAATASAQSSSPGIGASGGPAWLGDRSAREGIGIRAGDFELHPGVAGEFGYDSNWFQRADSAIERANAGSVVPALRLRITPSISLRSFGRRDQMNMEGAKPPALTLALTADASYNEFFPIEDEDSELIRDQRYVAGGVGAAVGILPGRTWSFDLEGAWRHTVEPSNTGGLNQAWDRDTIVGGGGVTWRPGGGLFQWRLVGYQGQFSLFQDEQFQLYDNGQHNFTTSGRWLFFPRSALIFDGRYRLVRYTDDTDQNDGDTMRARLGLNGLILPRLGVLAMGGWAASFYERSAVNTIVRNYDDFIVRAEVTWYLTAQSRLQPDSAIVGLSTVGLGYTRDFENSYLGDFSRSDRGYAQFNYHLAGVALASLEAGLNHVTYPDFNIGNPRTVHAGFSEDRIDVKAFLEYRPLETVGINATLMYDTNASQVIEIQEGDPTTADDLSFDRWRVFLGARWFM